MKPNWFIALPVQPAAWLAPLLNDVPRGVRAFHPDDLHITVAFLGGCSQLSAMKAWQLVMQRAHNTIQASLGTIRPMGRPQRPSAYAITLNHGHDDVATLIAQWRAPLLEAAGARPDHRDPLPHITVARPPARAKQAVRDAGLQWAMSLQIPTATIQLNHVALYTWNPNRKHKLFQITHQKPLNEQNTTKPI